MTIKPKSVFWQCVWVIIATLVSMFIGWAALEILSTGSVAASTRVELKAHEKLDLETTKLQNDALEREVQGIVKRLDRIETKIDKLQDKSIAKGI